MDNARKFAMSSLRAIIVAAVALSVAMLPVAGAMAHAMPSETSFVSVQSDCCPHSESCDKHAAGDCTTLAGCGLKCFGFSATVAGPSSMILLPSSSRKSALATEGVKSPTYNPPPPPPRV